MDRGGAAGHCTLARKDLVEMIKLATSTGWQPLAQLGVTGAA